MSFRYFAYGSNLWPQQIRSRCLSARPVGTGVLDGWELVCDKPSVDGSTKFNIRPRTGAHVAGVIYEVDERDSESLDEAEPVYTRVEVDVNGPAITYAYEDEPARARPYDWYVAMARAGAAFHGLTEAEFAVESDPDPLLPGIRPAGPEDMGAMEAVLQRCLTADNGRYSAHPGELSWWMYHSDPTVHKDTWWMHDEDAVLLVEGSRPEINLFALPGVDRVPLLEWAQIRRLDGAGELGWIGDEDQEMVEYLQGSGYESVHVDRSYRWDLIAKPPPTPELPDGWVLRHLQGESEADNRRAASHAAFESKMDPEQHLQRYLRFMRSPSYRPERDLVAVAPDGTIASFMIWWADDSGIAQIEPFGTHPDFHRKGVGRALLYYGLHEMLRAGMHTARVVTDDYRDATDFYEGVGFEDVGRIRWWGRP
ncbi:MAG TPA: GNAT family N-acetyltransferase [Acidimicrobiia bacterium]|nr:GNAT family N-acetyltransferase [Acidimicrobiia bacterium]